MTTRLARSTSLAAGLASVLGVSFAPALARAGACLEQQPAERAVIAVQRDDAVVRVEHTCAGWQAPAMIQGVRVLATDLVEDAGPAAAVLRVDQPGREPFERRVRVGDRLGERWVVVAASDGIVLIDDAGTLLAALDGRPVGTWRLTWHSPFSVVGLPSAAPAVAAPAGQAAKAGKPAAGKLVRPERAKPKVRK